MNVVADEAAGRTSPPRTGPCKRPWGMSSWTRPPGGGKAGWPPPRLRPRDNRGGRRPPRTRPRRRPRGAVVRTRPRRGGGGAGPSPPDEATWKGGRGSGDRRRGRVGRRGAAGPDGPGGRPRARPGREGGITRGEFDAVGAQGRGAPGRGGAPRRRGSRRADECAIEGPAGRRGAGLGAYGAQVAMAVAIVLDMVRNGAAGPGGTLGRRDRPRRLLPGVVGTKGGGTEDGAAAPGGTGGGSWRDTRPAERASG